jgi:DNA-binding PadR family transcriptional regulator
MSGEALKGHLGLLLLAALRGRPAHGYAIVEELKGRSGGIFDLPEGTIYPALHRLERQGLIESEWSDASGRRRRVYRLTRKGQRALGEKTKAWDTFTRGVAAALEGAT